MPSANKSIWRGPKAQHFTLVHRSQQDPLLHDGEASNRVLKATPRRRDGNAAAGESRAQLERELGAVAAGERKNVGEAAKYGVYFDDTEYDYMQHLRPIGGGDNRRRGGEDIERGEGEEVIMLEAPAAPTKNNNNKGKAKAKAAARDDDDVLTFKQQASAPTPAPLALPAEVLPSSDVMPRTFEEDKQLGIRPDMDPHLRQVLEALDDEAFLMRTARRDPVASASEQTAPADDEEEDDQHVEDDDDDDDVDADADDATDLDDFFGEIVKGGELQADEKEPEWRQLPPGGEEAIWLDPSARAARELLDLKQLGKGVESLSLESRVALFKKAAEEENTRKPAGSARAPPSSVGSKSIFGEKGASRKSRHAGAKARLAASFYAPSIDGGATAFSMSSSAMERNQGLTALDEQFARMERIYEQEDDDEDEENDDDDDGNDNEDAAEPDASTEAIFDEFLRRNEVIGHRMRERLGDEATTSAEKVDIIRRELGEMREVDRLAWDEAEAAGMGPDTTVEEQISRDLAARNSARREWDVETIQTTKTNVENHPRTIGASQSVAPSRVSRLLPGSIVGAGGVGAGSVAGGTDRMARIKIDPRTGNAVVAGYINVGARQARRAAAAVDKDDDDDNDDVELVRSSSPSSSPDDNDVNGDDDDDDDDDSDTSSNGTIQHPMTIKRDRNESKDEKRARKQAAKEEKQARKADKAQRKADFKAAVRRTTPASAKPSSHAATHAMALR